MRFGCWHCNSVTTTFCPVHSTVHFGLNSSFLFCFQMCHLYGGVHTGRHAAIPSLHACVPQGLYWWLADALLHVSLLHGARWCRTPHHVWNKLIDRNAMSNKLFLVETSPDAHTIERFFYQCMSLFIVRLMRQCRLSVWMGEKRMLMRLTVMKLCLCVTMFCTW